MRLKTDRHWGRGEERDTVRLGCLLSACDYVLDVPIRVNEEDRELLEKFPVPEVRRTFHGFLTADGCEIMLTSWGALPHIG
ncbi:MAG: hypothetical protein K8T20_12935 [Planctomycetes bacterium]|nr:hypothetical protein [Planctomycetota bacterium]